MWFDDGQKENILANLTLLNTEKYNLVTFISYHMTRIQLIFRFLITVYVVFKRKEFANLQAILFQTSG